MPVIKQKGSRRKKKTATMGIPTETALGRDNDDGDDTHMTATMDRCAVCIDVLSAGFINSYVEFFYLSHRYNETNELQRCELSEEQLIFVKENLIMAELSHRKSDVVRSHKAYKNIGDFFQQQREYQSAIYFYNKCFALFQNDRELQHTEKEKEEEREEEMKQLQLSTYLDLGSTYESLKEIDHAITFYEKHLQLVSELQRESEIKTANRNLIRTFKLQSDELRQQERYEEAIQVLHKCICAGQSAHDLHGESIAQRTLADILCTQRKYEGAIAHYKKYLKLCLEMDDKKGEGNAYLNLGRAYQQTGDQLLATKYYESYLQVAHAHNETAAESEAALALGDIYCALGGDNVNKQQTQRDSEKAIGYYSQNFALSRKLNLKQETSDARIKLGIAKSQQHMQQYLNLIVSKQATDLNLLLQWKNKRKTIQ